MPKRRFVVIKKIFKEEQVMKKTYGSPEVKLWGLDGQDVICTSMETDPGVEDLNWGSNPFTGGEI